MTTCRISWMVRFHYKASNLGGYLVAVAEQWSVCSASVIERRYVDFLEEPVWNFGMSFWCRRFFVIVIERLFSMCLAVLLFIWLLSAYPFVSKLGVSQVCLYPLSIPIQQTSLLQRYVQGTRLYSWLRSPCVFSEEELLSRVRRE
jgi:hypothetical protein